MSKENSGKTIRFKYIFPDDYNPKYISGAWGGINPSGDIVVNYYFERQGLPISETNEINPDGTLGKTISFEPEDRDRSFVRYVENGVVMSLQCAKEIHKWLGAKIQEAEEVDKLKKGCKQ